MGKLVDGEWVTDAPVATTSKDGRFERADASFRDRISPEAGARFAPEAGRYRLYVSLACPWAHRTLVVRALKGLEEAIPVSVVSPLMGANGWEFGGYAGATPDPVFGARFLYEVYQRGGKRYTGKATVPVLWDSKSSVIVNNESSEILRMLNDAFDAFAKRSLADLYPEGLRAEIDIVNARVYEGLNNGVYRAGFAKSQMAYDEAARGVFETLDWMEQRLATRGWLAGDAMTEADIRSFTTLARFDAVYHVHFKCNRRRIIDYPRLAYLARKIYELPGVAETVSFEHIAQHYYRSHPFINPSGLVPLGPSVDFRSTPPP